jgi:hypothetical protein
MSSQSKATRESQKQLLEGRLQARQAILEKKGVAAAEFKKDKVYQHLQAKHKAIVKAMAVIDEIAARKERAAVKEVSKAAPPPAPDEKKPKKEKAEKPAKVPKAAPSAPAG